MLLRISLIVAILAGIGALVVNHLMVGEKVKTTVEERATYLRERDQTRADLAKSNKSLKETGEALTTTSNQLVTTTGQLKTQTAKAQAADQKATQLANELVSTKQTLGTAQAELAAWAALGFSVDQVKGLITRNRSLEKERDVIAEENKVLLRDKKGLQAKLDLLLGGQEQIPDLPAGLKGKILAVDPKWDFVVLDIGRKQGVLERGRMLVNRGGKLMAKVQIMSVQDESSIANVLPGWKLEEVMEGDQVLY